MRAPNFSSSASAGGVSAKNSVIARMRCMAPRHEQRSCRAELLDHSRHNTRCTWCVHPDCECTGLGRLKTQVCDGTSHAALRGHMSKKLGLKMETVRELSSDDLDQVAGGAKHKLPKGDNGKAAFMRMWKSIADQ